MMRMEKYWVSFALPLGTSRYEKQPSQTHHSNILLVSALLHSS